MTDATILIGLLIVAITQLIKAEVPAVQGRITVAVALVLGVLVALLDTRIGVTDITIAQGLVIALSAVGGTVLAAKAGGGARGDDGTATR
jgi:uncharacterized membrane protein YGL010W